jgi:glutathione peroxidase
MVNVASKCGMTLQYAGLEALHREDFDQGLRILGFPCNQFGGQEPGPTPNIKEFCRVNYDVTFPILGKVDVYGPDAEPLCTYLRAQAPGDFGPASSLYPHISRTRPEAIGTDEIKWNFTKFLVDPEGEVVRRYEPDVTPQQIKPDLLQGSPPNAPRP